MSDCPSCGGDGVCFSLQGEEGRCPSCDGHGTRSGAIAGQSSYGATEMRCPRCGSNQFNLNWKGCPRCARCAQWC